jgi:NAD(P)-dependent dehydrogenase (short-subunit alcohol dehydrogenase family)
MTATPALQGRVALVTGAAQGIGRGVSLALASAGARVAVVDLDHRADVVAREVEARGAEALAISCDVRSRAEVRAAVDAVSSRFGRLDILVNNACAAVTDVPLVQVTDDDMALAWESGVLGTLYCLQAGYERLRESQGAVVNFGSIAGPTGMVGCAAYGPAKEAIRSLTKVAAREWGAAGIRVNAVCPNADSPSRQRWREEHPEVASGAEIEHLPLGRVGDCEADIGAAVVFLVGDGARYITGHTLMVDGGSCAW